jgi:hypothetical protein
MKEAFIEKRFNRSSRAIIDHANIIIREHQAEGYVLTLRQLYYQFVHRKLIENKQSEYKRIGSVINDARLAGLIDWDAIEDRMRVVREIPTYDGPGHFVTKQTDYFAEDLWADQDAYCEVWIEKDALVGVIERPCVTYRVPFFACRGYASQSGLYEAGVRLRRKMDQGKHITVFHLGDHDPSGLDMSRDNDERLNMFTRTLAGVELVRLALNQDQIEAYSLPPDPAKLTDSRAQEYIRRFGDTSWELDALPSREIDRLVMSSIVGRLDMKKFNAALERERKSREELKLVSRYWEGAVGGASADAADAYNSEL